jgi:hypothetical protein
MSATLAGGDYKIDGFILAGGSNSGTRIELTFWVNSLQDLDLVVDFDMGASTSRIPFGGALAATLPAGLHTIEIRAAQPTSPGTATLHFGSLQLERVA